MNQQTQQQPNPFFNHQKPQAIPLDQQQQNNANNRQPGFFNNQQNGSMMKTQILNNCNQNQENLGNQRQLQDRFGNGNSAQNVFGPKPPLGQNINAINAMTNNNNNNPGWNCDNNGTKFRSLSGIATNSTNSIERRGNFGQRNEQLANNTFGKQNECVNNINWFEHQGSKNVNVKDGELRNSLWTEKGNLSCTTNQIIHDPNLIQTFPHPLHLRCVDYRVNGLMKRETDTQNINQGVFAGGGPGNPINTASVFGSAGNGNDCKGKGGIFGGGMNVAGGMNITGGQNTGGQNTGGQNIAGQNTGGQNIAGIFNGGNTYNQIMPNSRANCFLNTGQQETPQFNLLEQQQNPKQHGFNINQPQPNQFNNQNQNQQQQAIFHTGQSTQNQNQQYPPNQPQPTQFNNQNQNQEQQADLHTPQSHQSTQVQIQCPPNQPQPNQFNNQQQNDCNNQLNPPTQFQSTFPNNFQNNLAQDFYNQQQFQPEQSNFGSNSFGNNPYIGNFCNQQIISDLYNKLLDEKISEIPELKESLELEEKTNRLQAVHDQNPSCNPRHTHNFDKPLTPYERLFVPTSFDENQRFVQDSFYRMDQYTQKHDLTKKLTERPNFNRNQKPYTPISDCLRQQGLLAKENPDLG